MSNELKPPESRGEKTLHDMIGGDYPLDPSQSRVESLLLELKEIIGSGSGGGGGWMIFNQDETSATRAIALTMDEARRIAKNGEPFIVHAPNRDYLFVHEKLSNISDGQVVWIDGILIGGTGGISDPVEIRKGQFNLMSGWESGFFETYNDNTGDKEYGVENTFRHLVIPKHPEAAEQTFDGSKFYIGYDPHYDNFGWEEVVPRADLTLDGQSEAALFRVFSLLRAQAAQTGQPANAYAPFDGDWILFMVRAAKNAHANVAMVAPAAFGNPFVLSLTSYQLSTSSTFQGTLVIYDTSDPTPSFSTIDVEIHFTLSSAAISVSPPKSYTSLSVD